MPTLECSLRSLTSPSSNELLQSHNSLTFKLLKTVADFSQALATLHDNFGHELQMLVETFRKRNGELRRERLHCPNSLFQVWELFLQQVEVNSQQHGDISRNFGQSIGNGLIERVFHRKIQSKKVFAHRDRIEAILVKSNELLLKCYNDYCQAYAMALTNPAQYMSEYIASHNVYVHQLQATNGMIHTYQTKTLPKLLEELEECHLETSQSISSSLLESCELVCEKSNEQASGYQMIGNACRQANHRQDLAQFVKQASTAAGELMPGSSPRTSEGGAGSAGSGGGLRIELGADDAIEKSVSIRYHQFQSPNLQNTELSQFDSKNMQIVPTFKNEIAPDLSQPPAQQQPQLEMDRESLEEKIERLEERIETLSKLLARTSESRLHNKVNELQEELCQKRFDLHVAQIHLSAVRSQLQLFEYNYRPNALLSATQLAAVGQVAGTVGGQDMVGVAGCDPASGVGVAGVAGQLANVDRSSGGGGGVGGGALSALALTRKSSSNSSSSHHLQPLGYRNKWIKAFKSLKESPAPAPATPIGLASGGPGGQAQKFAELDQQKLESQQQQQLQQQQQQDLQQQQQVPENQHFFQEYTFKKIASCDVCKDFLRGHMRQGVKCKLCKISCHNDCQSKAHAMLKCQQPKIKLLRRQKSAGELEVNHSDADSGEPSERTLSSKPDSIYQLIRQVLDAKKKGQSGGQHQQQQYQQQHHQLQMHLQQQQQQQHLQHMQDADYHLRVPYGTLAGSGALMHLSTGNLALANHDGKSVSTSALGTASAAAASVDRWAVVMDLLAESRAKKSKDKEASAAAKSAAAAAAEASKGNEPGAGKRHSKQLDKFKLAAKSAAAASKHQQRYMKQQQQQQVEPQQQQQPQAGHSNSPSPNSSYQMHHHLAAPQGADLAPNYLGHQLSHGPGAPGAGADGSLHLHHTKSLPVGQLAPQAGNSGVGQVQPVVGDPQVSGASMSLAGPAGSSQQASGGQQQPQQAQPYQLFNLGSQQQLQSTSAPHSPQRKRFNLRMKSFSLDSPESPSVIGAPSAPNGPASGGPGSAYPSQAQLYASGTSLHGAEPQQRHPQQPQLHQQQQQQHHLHHQQHYEPAANHHHGSSLYLGSQQQQQQQLYVGHLGQQQQQPGGYHAAGQPSYLHQYQYADEAADRQLSAYLSATQVRHGSQAGQYQHRHSYHNQTGPYGGAGSQAGGLLEAGGPGVAAGQHSSSHSALNSLHLSAGELVHQQQQQKQQQQQQQQNKQHGNADESQPNSGDNVAGLEAANDYYDLDLDVGLRSGAAVVAPAQAQQAAQQRGSGAGSGGNTYVALYDYAAQRSDEMQLSAGQLVALIDSSERDWWKVRALDGSHCVGYFPASYLAKLYQNERPLQVVQTIQVSNGESCNKLLRGQIVIHTGKQMDNFVTIRTVTGDASNHYIQCPDKYLMEVSEAT